jgi:hypothetical protein
VGHPITGCDGKPEQIGSVRIGQVTIGISRQRKSAPARGRGRSSHRWGSNLRLTCLGLDMLPAACRYGSGAQSQSATCRAGYFDVFVSPNAENPNSDDSARVPVSAQANSALCHVWVSQTMTVKPLEIIERGRFNWLVFSLRRRAAG